MGTDEAPIIARFLRAIRQRFTLSDVEAQLLESKMLETQSYGPGDFLVLEGERVTYSSLLLEGYACRCKDDPHGDRQIMEIQIPGDFVDLHSYPLEVLDHAICALSDCKIVKFAHSDISQLVHESPRLARILWFATMVDASIHREWIMNIGSRAGKVRVAHLLCELFCRSEVVGLTDGHSYPMPLSQIQVGECLGFSQMHVNRLMRELREMGLVTMNSRRVDIHDWDGLREVAEFDATYLYLGSRES